MSTKVVFSHKPLEDGMYDFNIHGHLHNNTWHDAINDNKHYLISLELNGYKAESLNKIVDKHNSTVL
jgi:calcineurin-like phosphoesterase family protein